MASVSGFRATHARNPPIDVGTLSPVPDETNDLASTDPVVCLDAGRTAGGIQRSSTSVPMMAAATAMSSCPISSDGIARRGDRCRGERKHEGGPDCPVPGLGRRRRLPQVPGAARSWPTDRRRRVRRIHRIAVRGEGHADQQRSEAGEQHRPGEQRLPWRSQAAMSTTYNVQMRRPGQRRAGEQQTGSPAPAEHREADDEHERKRDGHHGVDDGLDRRLLLRDPDRRRDRRPHDHAEPEDRDLQGTGGRSPEAVERRVR